MSEHLDSTDFDRFFRAVRTDADRPTAEHLASAPGPFPWQQRLVDELLSGSPDGREAGQWPTLLDLPTGSGKTVTIDIALFALACREDAPRRIVFVVDRRVVVQQAATWANKLAQKLNDAWANPAKADPIVHAVAERLAAKAAPLPPDSVERRAVVVAELRGGIAADPTWAQRPDVPAIITSTVDQVGSRLLMQGYGVSDSMRPVHAGLLAHDVLFLLDEVHLSQPFADTLGAVERYRSRTVKSVWPDQRHRWQVVQLSATPRDSAIPSEDAIRKRFSLVAADRSGALGQRLSAHKSAVVLTGPKARGGETPEDAMARILAEQALSVAKKTENPAVIGVVANRVAIATAVARRLERASDRVESPYPPKVLLLTGRMRPFERDQFLAEWVPQVRTGRDRRGLKRDVFVVGTQSIEAGVDFDLDALVTQAASLDALKQRFGRVDRQGDLAAGGRASSNVIVCSAPSRQAGPDPVYGDALAVTEKWLLANGQVDFGIDHLVVDQNVQVDGCAEPKRAPALLPSHLDAWAQNPTPHFAPEVAAWLHGPDSESDPDVSVVWRNELVDRDTVFVAAMLDAVPIRSDEAVDVPMSHVRGWLWHRRTAEGLADVEGIKPLPVSGPAVAPRRFLVVTPDGTVTGGRPSAVRPGDTVIVDGAEGGLTMGSWDPSSIMPVVDLSAISHSASGGDSRPPPARLDLALGEAEKFAAGRRSTQVEDANWVYDWVAGCPMLVTDPDLPSVTVADVRVWIESMPGMLRDVVDKAAGTEYVHLRALCRLYQEKTFQLIEIPSQDESGTSVLAPTASVKRAPNSDRESSSTIGRQVALDVHSDDTAKWAAGFLRAVGVAESDIAEHPVTIAARYHDIGKADRRFQLQLWEGRINGPLLAKSAIPADDWRRRRAAQVNSGYPRAGRHELLSAAMLRNSPLMEHPDAALVGHLVASHHGRGRPFAPALRTADDGDPGEQDVPIGDVNFRTGSHNMISVGSPVAEWFWHSLREQGWFGNAWLTAVLRLADHQASQYPSRVIMGDNDG